MPQYNYETVTPNNLKQYAKDLERTAKRVKTIARWMEEDKVKGITAHNSTIGIRAQAYSSKYAQALEEAMFHYKVDHGLYRVEG